MRNWDVSDILYEDSAILVCRKHAGMAVQSAGIGQMDMESALRIYRKGGFVGIVQRLDQPVEGVLVFGKTAKDTAALNVQQQNGKMKKTYLAVFTGEAKQNEAVLEDYLCKDARTNTSRAVDAKTAGAKKSLLSYKVLKTSVCSSCCASDLSENSAEKTAAMQIGLAKVTLGTGRHHQIRVQMSQHGMPLWADGKYKKHLSEAEQGQPIGLCACCLEFEHPKTKKKMKFEIEPEGEIFKKFI